MKNDEFIRDIIDNFSAELVTDVLSKNALIPDTVIRYQGELKPFVFLHGDSSEVYSQPEIEFINSIGEIIVYDDFFMNTNRGTVACRVISVRLCAGEDSLMDAIAFEKIIDKATDGFNFFFIAAQEGIRIGCSGVVAAGSNYSISKNLSDDNEFEEYIQYLWYLPNENFIDYYNSLRQIICMEDVKYLSYEEKRMILRGPQYRYLEGLEEIERIYHINMSGEKRRYLAAFCENINEEPYSEVIRQAEEMLFPIVSTKVNAMEMLFDAEEVEKLSQKTEEENEKLVEKQTENEQVPTDQSITKEMLNDPEAVIKLLKKKRGL